MKKHEVEKLKIRDSSDEAYIIIVIAFAVYVYINFIVILPWLW